MPVDILWISLSFFDASSFVLYRRCFLNLMEHRVSMPLKVQKSCSIRVIRYCWIDIPLATMNTLCPVLQSSMSIIIGALRFHYWDRKRTTYLWILLFPFTGKVKATDRSVAQFKIIYACPSNALFTLTINFTDKIHLISRNNMYHLKYRLYLAQHYQLG